MRAALALVAAGAMLVGAAPVAAQTVTPIQDAVNNNPGFGEYVSVAPVRVLDTRDGTGGVSARVEAGARVEVPVTEPASVPDEAWAVAVNITVIEPDADGFLTAVAPGEPFTDDTGAPLASNVNFVEDQTVPNLALVGVLGRQGISLQINAGTAHVAVDVVGYVIGTDDERGARLMATSPRRVYDSRPVGKLGGDAFIDVEVPGIADGATGVALNVTATGGTEASFLTVYAPEVARPNASSLTVTPEVTRPNLVFTGVSRDNNDNNNDKVRIYNYAGEVDVVVDVVGVFSPVSDPTTLTGRILPRSTPYRGFDSRQDGFSLPLGSGTPISVNFGGIDGEVGSGVQAALMNVTATEGSLDSYLTVYPATGIKGAGGPPQASTLNWREGEVNPNLAIVAIGGAPGDEDRYVGVYNYAGIVHFVLDEFAYVLA